MTNDLTTIKTFFYLCGAVIGLAGTFFGIGKYFGRKNHETTEIKELKQIVEANETRNKARLYAPDGSLLFVRAVDCDKSKTSIRADISKTKDKQQAYEVTLGRIDSNVDMLVGLIKDYLKLNN